MQTVTGLYDNHRDARKVVEQLEDAGISSSDITIAGRDGDNDESYAGEGAAAGAGVGPVVAAGWLAATAAGAAAGAVAGGAAGGVIGSLTSSGVDEDDAHVYAEGVRRGSTLVSARVKDDQADIARSIINNNAPVDLDSRRSMYREEGWDRFDETSAAFTEEELARERDRVRTYHPL